MDLKPITRCVVEHLTYTQLIDMRSSATYTCPVCGNRIKE